MYKVCYTIAAEKDLERLGETKTDAACRGHGEFHNG